MEIKTEKLTAETFAPFGDLIVKPERPEDAGGPAWKWWGDNAFMDGEGTPYQVGLLDLQPAELKFDWAERHMHSQELIVPTGGDCLIYVGPPETMDEPSHLPPLDRFKVFRLRPNQAVLLKKGVWHGPPLAVDRPVFAVVLLHKGVGENDLYPMNFPETPVTIIA